MKNLLKKILKKELMKLANTLNKITPKIPSNIDWILQVEGHTDHIPIYNAKFQSNWDLSSARSASVANYLLDNTPVEPGRVTITGFADSKPIADNSTAEGRAKNRRIEVIVDG